MADRAKWPSDIATEYPFPSLSRSDWNASELMLTSETLTSQTTVLVIDDDANLATVFCDLLDLNGFSTLVAATGEKGLELARRYQPQLIVCDVGLPDVNGYSVLESLRSHPSTTTIPVVMFTGRVTIDAFRHSMELGADDYLTKPIEPDSFLRAVRTQIFKREQLTKYLQLESTIGDTALSYDHLASPTEIKTLESRFEKLKQQAWLGLWTIQLCNYQALQGRYGHTFSQLAVQGISQQLRRWKDHWNYQSSIQIDTLAYLGAEWFILFLTSPEQQTETHYTTALSTLRHELQQSIVVNNHRLIPEIRLVPTSYEDPTTVGALSTELKLLNYFTPVVSSLSMAARLQHAMQNDELQLYFQPQIDLISGQIIGAEALVRWIVPDEPPISPVQLISIAEENGLMLPLGEWILEAALQQLSQWQAMKLSGISIAVNLSAYQLNSPQFIDRLMGMVRAANVSPVMMDLELPESLIMKDIGRAQFLLSELQKKGFSTAIDNFGSGHSTLSHLQYLSVNILKLDKCFIRDLHYNKSNQIIVKAIVEMARGLNISTIAGGVETARELSAIKRLKCHSMQGYLFSPALPAKDFEALLLESTPGDEKRLISYV